MNKQFLCVMGVIGLSLCGCNNKDKNGDVVSQRYIHKFGYDVSKDEWESSQYPGQVVTTLKNGVTITSSYEDGILNGQTTYTHPHTQTLESLFVYKSGNLTKKVSYDLKGVPTREDNYLSPSHLKSKFWYSSGTPMSLEEYLDTSLLEGEYFNTKNEMESKVENGFGIKTIHKQDGLLIAKETIENGKVVKSETFFANGIPHLKIAFKDGIINGEKKLFSTSGDPVIVENYLLGKLHGACEYFQNGYRYLETSYRNGLKEGIERQYIDGETLVEETEYHDGIKHGPSTFYYDGLSRTEWFYNNELVSKSKFDELSERERIISIMNDRASPKQKIQMEDDFILQDEFIE